MKMLANSISRATLAAMAFGLAVVAEGASASAQLSPTGVSLPPSPKPTPPSASAPGATLNGVVGAGGAVPVVKATPKPADAKALTASGDKKFKAADYAGALTDFEAANGAKASPETERSIGLSHDKLGHFAEAVVAYERFLGSVPAKAKDPGDETKRRVEVIKAMPAKVHVETTPAGAQILVDPAGTSEAAATGASTASTLPTSPADLVLKAGKHVVRVTLAGFDSVDKDVDAAYGASVDVKVELVKKVEPVPVPPPVEAEVATPQPPSPEPAPVEPRSKVPAYVTGAVALVAAGVGAGFGIKALSQSSDFGSNPTTKRADDGENNALVADMLFGVAITFGVTSAVLFLSGDAPAITAQRSPAKVDRSAQRFEVAAVRRGSKPASSISIIPTPYVTPSGGGAGALVRF